MFDGRYPGWKPDHASGKKYDAVICLGAVIRGATPHFDYVAAEVSKGVAQVGLETGLPIIFGVLTTDNLEQAIELPCNAKVFPLPQGHPQEAITVFLSREISEGQGEEFLRALASRRELAIYAGMAWRF